MAESSTTTSSSAGIGFAGLLTVAFVVLKLCHIINWSWWWVLSPLWISFLIGVAIVLVVLCVLVVVEVRKQSKKKAYR